MDIYWIIATAIMVGLAAFAGYLSRKAKSK